MAAQHGSAAADSKCKMWQVRAKHTASAPAGSCWPRPQQVPNNNAAKPTDSESTERTMSQKLSQTLSQTHQQVLAGLVASLGVSHSLDSGASVPAGIEKCMRPLRRAGRQAQQLSMGSHRACMGKAAAYQRFSVYCPTVGPSAAAAPVAPALGRSMLLGKPGSSECCDAACCGPC